MGNEKQATIESIKAKLAEYEAKLGKVDLRQYIVNKGGTVTDCTNGDYFVKVPGMVRGLRVTVQGFNKIERELVGQNELTRYGKALFLVAMKRPRI